MRRMLPTRCASVKPHGGPATGRRYMMSNLDEPEAFGMVLTLADGCRVRRWVALGREVPEAVAPSRGYS